MCPAIMFISYKLERVPPDDEIDSVICFSSSVGCPLLLFAPNEIIAR